MHPTRAWGRIGRYLTGVAVLAQHPYRSGMLMHDQRKKSAGSVHTSQRSSNRFGLAGLPAPSLILTTLVADRSLWPAIQVLSTPPDAVHGR